MKEPKPIPQVPAALCGIYPGARVIVSPKCWWADSTQSWHAYPYNVPGEHPYVVRCSDFKYYGSLTLEDMTLPLDSPLAMCHAARWLAGRLGMDPGVTAPEWRYNGSHWYLMCVGGKVAYFYDYENGPTKQTEYSWWLRVPGVNNMSPAEALAAACVAVSAAPA